MTSLTESSTDTAQDTQNAATAVSENLIEHPRGAESGKPGRRDAFYFEQKNRLPDAADGKGRGGAACFLARCLMPRVESGRRLSNTVIFEVSFQSMYSILDNGINVHQIILT